MQEWWPDGENLESDEDPKNFGSHLKRGSRKSVTNLAMVLANPEYLHSLYESFHRN